MATKSKENPQVTDAQKKMALARETIKTARAETAKQRKKFLTEVEKHQPTVKKRAPASPPMRVTVVP